MKTVDEIKPIARQLALDTMHMLDNLYGRWLDEREYEDFADYAKVMETEVKKLLPEAEFVCGTKRPFGFRVAIENWRVSIQRTATQLVWKMEKRY